MVEAGSPNVLLRRGFTKQTVATGTQVVVEGYQSKDGSKRANGRDITLPDGKKLFLGSSGTGAPYDEKQVKEHRHRDFDSIASVAASALMLAATLPGQTPGPQRRRNLLPKPRTGPFRARRMAIPTCRESGPTPPSRQWNARQRWPEKPRSPTRKRRTTKREPRKSSPIRGWRLGEGRCSPPRDPMEPAATTFCSSTGDRSSRAWTASSEPR